MSSEPALISSTEPVSAARRLAAHRRLASRRKERAREVEGERRVGVPVVPLDEVADGAAEDRLQATVADLLLAVGDWPFAHGHAKSGEQLTANGQQPTAGGQVANPASHFTSHTVTNPAAAT